MPIAVTGSIATDHLMHFPGRFADQLLADQLRPGVAVASWSTTWSSSAAGSPATSLRASACSGTTPLLVGAVGRRLRRLPHLADRHGVDCSGVLVCDDVQTARFVCTTDDDMRQIASFYAGAMAQAREIELAAVARAAAWTWW